MTGTHSWSDEQIQLLVQCWNEGFSATQISELIPGKTRNAIIGKVRRLKLPFRQPLEKIVKLRRPKNPRGIIMMESKPVIPKPTPPSGKMIPFMEAGPTTCRSIEGREVDSRGYSLAVFCSNPKIPEETYCPYHQGIYYRADTRRE